MRPDDDPPTSIEHFVADVLDVRLSEARVIVRHERAGAGAGAGASGGGGGWLRRLLDSAHLRHNLAFQAAWARALDGAPPSRLDWWAYVAELGGRRDPAASTPDARAGALARVLLAHAPLMRLVGSDDAHARVRRGAAELEAAAARMPHADVVQALTDKLVTRLSAAPQRARARLDRHLADVPPPADASAGRGLLQAYMWLCQDAATSALPRFEAWAAVPNRAGPPRSVREHHARAAAVLRALDLPRRDPLSGYAVMDTAAAREAADAGLACAEALRAAILRDGHLWRVDGGGGGKASLICIDDRAAADAMPHALRALARAARTRCVVAAPVRAIACALPASLYANLVVVTSAPRGGRRAEVALPDVPLWRERVHRVAHVVCGGKQAEAEAEADAEAEECGVFQPVAAPVATLGGPPPHGASLPDDDVWAPLVASSYAGPPPGWAAPLEGAACAAALLGPALAHPGQLACQRLMTRLAFARGLDGADADAGARGGAQVQEQEGDVVVVDTRENVWSALSLRLALAHLRPGAWRGHVVCSSGVAAFYRRCLGCLGCLGGDAAGVRVHACERLDAAVAGGGGFDLEAYNALLTSEAFWERFAGPWVLVVQDDGVLARTGLDAPGAPFLRDPSVDYWGAPWRRDAQNAELEARVPSLVGNGGLSLRRAEAMRRACRDHGDPGDEHRRLFFHALQPVQEDVFFGAVAHALGRAADADAAERLSFEQRLPRHDALGFHKPWAYMPHPIVRAAFEAMLDDALRRREDGGPAPGSPPPGSPAPGSPAPGSHPLSPARTWGTEDEDEGEGEVRADSGAV